MNIAQANNLDFPALMSKLGFEPAKVTKGGNDLWYFSPFREETEPSFHIRKGRTYEWVWHDFGEGGTTLVQFIKRYFNLDNSGALQKLDELFPNKGRGIRPTKPKNLNQVSFSFPFQSSAAGGQNFSEPLKDTRDLEFIKDSPLQSPLIFSYLEGRGIGAEYAKRYFRLVHYRNRQKPTQKPYFAIGMKNQSGGFEIRSATDHPKMKFKSALIARDFSFIRGREQGRGVNVFEGMLDFVSLLVMYGVERMKGDAIILHGLTMYGRAADFIRKQGYTCINTFLDNNHSGQETTQFFVQDFGDIVTNYSSRFLPHTDLNDALRANYIPNFSSLPPSPQP